ncbi:MAG: DUF4837 family protein [Bacteroidetes bacterium]|nr:MAG: DUF4837 family protein [Bacteroidota bacterium]
MHTSINTTMALFFSAMRYTGICCLIFLLSNCSSEGVQRFQEVPTAFGRLNYVAVICDKDVWEGPIGDSIRFYYQAAYPILPQPEPIFDLRHVSIDDLRKEPVIRELRHFLVIANLGDETSPTARMIREDIGAEKIRSVQEGDGMGSHIVRNKWAKNQSLFYVYAFDEEKLLQNIVASADVVIKNIRQRDSKMIEATTFFNGENESIEAEVRTKMKVDMRIPEDFFIALNEADVMWLRRETPDVSANILLQRVPYTDRSQLSAENIKAIRDSIGRKYVSSSLPGTYMRINDVDLPCFVEVTTLNGDYALEARGIWDIVNDFMGGPFVSYLVYDPAKADLLFLDGFIHAPGKDKRELMQQIEFILQTAKY